MEHEKSYTGSFLYRIFLPGNRSAAEGLPPAQHWNTLEPDNGTGPPPDWFRAAAVKSFMKKAKGKICVQDMSRKNWATKWSILKNRSILISHLKIKNEECQYQNDRKIMMISL